MGLSQEERKAVSTWAATNPRGIVEALEQVLTTLTIRRGKRRLFSLNQWRDFPKSGAVDQKRETRDPQWWPGHTNSCAEPLPLEPKCPGPLSANKSLAGRVLCAWKVGVNWLLIGQEPIFKIFPIIGTHTWTYFLVNKSAFCYVYSYLTQAQSQKHTLLSGPMSRSKQSGSLKMWMMHQVQPIKTSVVCLYIPLAVLLDW